MRPERILFLNPAGWQKDSINLGLALLAGTLRSAGFESLQVDLNAFPLEDAVLVRRIQAYGPALIGISIKTATAEEGARLGELVRRHFPAVPLLVGGPHITLCGREFLEHCPAFDFGLLGEAEHSLLQLVGSLFAGAPLEDVSGLAWRQGGELRLNPWGEQTPPRDLDLLPLPDLDSIEGHSWEGFRYPLLTSRGCPFECIYCCVNKLTRSRKWRARSASEVVDELQWAVTVKRIDAFEILDDNFTLDMERAKAFCRELITRRLNLSWYCHNGIRADRIDPELAGLMAEAGCTSVAFGIESGCPRVFDSIKKGEPLDAVTRAVRIVKEAGIQAVGYFIIGLPGDTLESFVETVRFQRSLRLRHHVFGMLIPYPGTEVWDLVARRGRMFADITQTRHFTEGAPLVCFELPEFPRRDMTRAYYIAKYFELFEAVQTIVARGGRPVLVYADDPALFRHLPGIVAACGPETRHVAPTAAAREAMIQEALDWRPRIEYGPVSLDEFPAKEALVVCTGDRAPRAALFGRTGLALLVHGPSGEELVLARQPS